MTILPHEKQIVEYEQTIKQVKEQNKNNALWTKEEIKKIEKKLEILKENVYSNLSAWDRILICRHPKRPHSKDYLENICDEYLEIFGDRTISNDNSIITALVKIDNCRFVFIGQEKGNDTESRIYRNFGMPQPEGYRKALRAMKLAEKFKIPVVSLLDTPGAYPGLSAEERGQGWAIAKNLWEMAKLETPVIVVLIGEGCSGGALGIGVGDRIGMLQHSYYSVISPEGCASILYKDPTKNAYAAGALKMHAEDLINLKVIDEIIIEPQGGAHLDVELTYQHVKSFILSAFDSLKNIDTDILVEQRYEKFRNMGDFTKE
ncbi:MAG: acetyl-CoA carboxylase carboxyltransferase subunit alpha [Parachlamydiales bacterium]|jgi:acetyl-CoA carboxylase carboxyl transferase subunit alpha